MTAWNHNIDEAPRGKTVQTQRLVTDKNSASGQSLRIIEEFVTDYVWLATKCGKVFRSHWIETKFSPARWAGLGTKEQPIAWQAYVVPEHPFTQATATETMGGTGDDCSFGNRGVWPPQGGASSSRGNDSLSVVTAGETAPFILEDCGSGA